MDWSDEWDVLYHWEEHKLKCELWETRDGKVIPISKLSDDHLKAIPPYLHKSGRNIPASIEHEIMRRGFTLLEDGTVVEDQEQWDEFKKRMAKFAKEEGLL